MRRFGVFGSELGVLPDFNFLEKAYIRCFGSLSRFTVQRYLLFKYFPLKLFKEKNINPGKILDFGCAFGNFGFMAARRMKRANVFLYDTDPKAKIRCAYIIKKAKYHNVTFLGKEQLEKENGFSFIIFTDVLEHIEDDYGALQDIYKRIVNGGYLYLSVPFYREERLRNNDLYHGHVRTGYRMEEIQSLLQKVGFQIILKPKYRTTPRGALLFGLVKLYLKLTRTPDSPSLDFDNFKSVSFWKKGLLALVWPLYRLILELDIAIHGLPDNSIILLAQK